MCCVACMICVHDVAVEFAIALLFMSKKDKMQQQQINGIVTRLDVSNMACICFV